jgi:hypothetical protein
MRIEGKSVATAPGNQSEEQKPPASACWLLAATSLHQCLWLNGAAISKSLSGSAEKPDEAGKERGTELVFLALGKMPLGTVEFSSVESKAAAE